ncbi:DUF2924 domain-containing protein [Mesorhizobium marinum]|uniref:DUF2924 domain-containing protein n=1 Tax=Mesorhizobium marinum TaxID=3228790 RepID=UPI003465451E
MSKVVLIDKEVAALGDLSREELSERWTKTYGHPPPKGARRDFLLRAAAWHEQANRLGGLPTDTRPMLRAAIARMKKQFVAETGSSAAELDASASSEIAKPRKLLSPGARLVREWNGRSHVVDVLEEGFAFEGRLHKSLTAIARQITGAH